MSGMILRVQRLSAVIAATLILLSLNTYSAEPGPNLATPEAYALVEAGKLTLIDIRRPEEWRRSGGPGMRGRSIWRLHKA